MDATPYPVNLIVADWRCLVVGAGRVAAAKVRELLACGALVHVVAPDICDELADQPAITFDRRPYRAGDLDGCRLAVAATDQPEVNAAVYRDGEEAGVWVNSADDPANCSFTLPARLRQGPLLVAFSTGGNAPAVATWLRRTFSDTFGPEYGELIRVVASQREELRLQGRSTEGLDWQSGLDSGMLELIRQGRVAEAKELLRTCLGL